MLCSHYVQQLKACAKHEFLSIGQKLHAQIIKLGLYQYGPLPNFLLYMYRNCRMIDDVIRLFDEMPCRNTVSWALILTCHNHGDLPNKTLSIFPKMWELDRLKPDHYVIANLVKACASLCNVRIGKQVHGYFLRSPFYNDDVIKSSLADMYSKCGLPDYGRRVFDSIQVKDTISWTALISGYARTGRTTEALELFSNMHAKDLQCWSALISGLVQSGHEIDALRIFVKMRREVDRCADPFILSSLISASTSTSTLLLGKQLHCFVIVHGYKCNLFISNALVDMYAKCSDLPAARYIFSNMPLKDVVSWNSIIVGTAQHGQAIEALSLYDAMVKGGVKPNQVTFLGLIYACSHVGLVSKGQYLFNSMIKVYGIRPSLQLYTCLVDLLCRAGHLVEAETLLKTMPYKPDEAAWASLLSACRHHRSAKVAVTVADHILQLGPQDHSTFVLLSNTYAAACMWASVSKVRKLMSLMDFKSEPGYSCIELATESHVFYAGEMCHPMRDKFYGVLKDLDAEMRKSDHILCASYVLDELE